MTPIFDPTDTKPVSADNYYLIRRTPTGTYTAVMGFESDTHEPTQSAHDPEFTTLNDALTWALDQHSEYGVSVHPECDDTPTPESTGPFLRGDALFSNTPAYPHDAEWATLGLHVLADAVADYRGVPFDNDGYRPLITSSLTDPTPHRNWTFTLNPYCWCDGEEPGHENGCPPNFIHHPTGLTITWYKHAGRAITSNKPRPHNWTVTISDCIHSLRRH